MNLEVKQSETLVFGSYQAGNVFIKDDKDALADVLAILTETSDYLRDKLLQL